MTTILFLHGWQSIPCGVKPTYLKDHGHTVINPKLPDDDFAEAVRIAQDEFDKYQPQVVVGSSGGNEHRQWRCEARPALPGVEEIWIGEDGQDRNQKSIDCTWIILCHSYASITIGIRRIRRGRISG